MFKLIINSIVILVVGIIVNSCYDINRESNIYSTVPRGQGANANTVILKQEYIVTGEAKVTRSVNDIFDRTDLISNDVLIEIDTLKRFDKLKLKIDTGDEIRVKIYVSVYRSDTLLQHLWYRGFLKNKKSEKILILD